MKPKVEKSVPPKSDEPRQTTITPLDRKMKQRALQRWEGEGGGLPPTPEAKPDAPSRQKNR